MAQTGNHKGLQFGIFLAPFHRVGENPTLGMARDMELIEWLDELGYDEAWIGEHHSAGWETIASPEVFMGAAIERTRYIRLGSGVTSLPYHHPLMVANRFVQLDHMSRGRTMLGCGPGALPSDAYMMGIEPSTQRDRMEQSLAAIMALLKCEEPVTMKTDWFELKEARLHLAPYSYPHFPIACASTITPSGMIAAGKHGLGVLSIGHAADQLYYKPNWKGNDTKTYARKADASVFCTDRKFTLSVENGLAYCHASNSTVHTAPVICVNNTTLYTTDQLPQAMRDKFGMADKCLKAGANADNPANYYPPGCGTDSTGGGFSVVVKPGADTCEKTLTHEDVMTPGIATFPNQHFLPQDLIERLAVRCPANSALELENMMVTCKVGARVPPPNVKK